MANEQQYNPNLTLDEMVFENRNKEYGAYDLRSNYARLLTKSFIIGTILFLLIALSPLIYGTIKKLTAPPKAEVKATLVDLTEAPEEVLDQPEDTPPPPPPPPKEEQPQQEIVQNVVPEPVKAPKIETPPPPISVQKETTTGLVNQEGIKAPTYTPPVVVPPSTGGKEGGTGEKPVVSKTEVYNTVDQAADFGNGGINGFRTRFQENFDQDDIEAEGTLKTEITFIVEPDGSISNVKATGSNSAFNRQAERAVKAIRGKWTPGKVKGEPVRSRFRFPVTMNFE